MSLSNLPLNKAVIVFLVLVGLVILGITLVVSLITELSFFLFLNTYSQFLMHQE